MVDPNRSVTGPVTLAIRVKQRSGRAKSLAVLVLQAVSGAAMFALMLHVLANVAMRYFFATPLPGTTEWVQYWYMPVMVFVGFILAKHAKQMIEAPVIFDRLTWGNRRILVVLNSLSVVATCLLIAYFSLTELALHGLEIRQTGGVMGLEIWPVFFVIPAVFVGLAGMYAWDAVEGIRGRFSDATADGEMSDSAVSEAPDDIRVKQEERS